MITQFIPGELSNKALASCYKYLKEKFRREKITGSRLAGRYQKGRNGTFTGSIDIKETSKIP